MTGAGNKGPFEPANNFRAGKKPGQPPLGIFDQQPRGFFGHPLPHHTTPHHTPDSSEAKDEGSKPSS